MQLTNTELMRRVEYLEREIVAQEQREKELLASQFRLDSLLKNLPMAVILWDMDLKVIEWNPAAEFIFGYSHKEAIGKHATDLLLYDDNRAEIDAVINLLIEGRGGTRNKNRNFTKKGETIFCDWFNTLLREENGGIIGVTSLVNDISHNKRIEDALIKSEKEYRSTLNHLVVGVVVHSNDSSVLMSNPKAGEILGLTEQQLSGKINIDPFWNFVHEDLSIMNFSDYPVSQVFSTQKAVNNLILGIKRPDREFITWTVVNATPIFTRSGDLIKVIVNFVDITALKKSERAKLILEQQLQQSQKMEAIGTLAVGIAHDFNNLLTPILSYTQLAKVQVEPCSLEVGYLTKVEESANRAKDLVNKILSISRGSTTQTEFISLETLVEEVSTVIRASIPKTIKICTSFESNLPNICADPSQIYHVILNFCTNAVQSLSGKGELRISLNKVTRQFVPAPVEESEEEYLCLSFIDSGCGMDASTIARIYEPFFTTKHKSEQRGTGLGLSMVTEIIAKHKGYMSVNSTLGKGSQFKIYLPISNVEEHVPSKQDEQPLIYGDANILLVDDEIVLCELLTGMLNTLGYKVTACSDSNEALEIFKSAPQAFQLVISDYSMPSLDGGQLMQQIKSIRSDIPMLLITGYSDDTTENIVKALGGEGIITKPFDLKKFSHSISESLPRKASRNS